MQIEANDRRIEGALASIDAFEQSLGACQGPGLAVQLVLPSFKLLQPVFKLVLPTFSLYQPASKLVQPASKLLLSTFRFRLSRFPALVPVVGGSQRHSKTSDPTIGLFNLGSDAPL